MSDYTGEDVLNAFSDLNVRLLHLNPNVVKAWFDTDDKDIINLLTWMCTSLSKKNYVSPLENNEFLELETLLVDEKYEKELKNISEDHPGIFEIDSNALEIEFLEDEIELLLEEEKQIDDLIRMNEILQKNLSKELSFQTSKEIETSLKVNSTQELCNCLGEKLDDLNIKLHTQLMKYASNLYDFEFGCIPHFINNMDVNECQENFENIASFLMLILEADFLPTDITGLENRTYLDGIDISDSITNSLNTMRSRLFYSHQNYLVTKIEVEKSREILLYLNKVNVDSIMSYSDSMYTQMSKENKEETKRRMCGLLENLSAKLADHQISQTKFKYAQQELELNQEKLRSIKKVEETILKCLSQYILLNMLFIQEKKDIDSSDQFFRKILRYINKDLQNCVVRMQKMKQIIQQYEGYGSKSISERCKLMKSIIKVLSDEEDFNLNKALEVVAEFKNEVCMLENKLFCCDVNHYKSTTNNLANNINILQSFLVCGPTHRIVLVPSDLQHVLREVEEHLKKQIGSVKSALEMSSNMKRIIPNKWQNYRRQLWMYFYTDPQKLFFIIQQIENELKNVS